jgi:hypothetical protein
MATLDELARVLGGVVRITGAHHWLDTAVGDLRAVVIRRPGPHSSMTTYDLAVFMPCAREQDPFHPHYDAEWRLDGQDVVLPRLRHGYVFSGCRAGVLFATSPSPPSLEHIVVALWELADSARKAWRPLTDDERKDGRVRERRRRWQRQLARLGFVATVVVIAAVFRRIR